MLSIQYYALPILRDDSSLVDRAATFASAASVGSFLLVAAGAYWVFLELAVRRRKRDASVLIERTRLVRFAFVGMSGGLIFYIALLSGWLDWLDTYFGVVRGVVFTFVSIACYLLGSARAARLISGHLWVVALGLLAALFIYGISGLLLVGGVMNLLAFAMGYVVTARRIPWAGLAIGFALISVLQAGKYDIRARYWGNNQGGIALADVPAAMIDWVDTGVSAVAAGTVRNDAMQRASLLWVVIGVEELTPEFVPYLGGETYTLLPPMLVPRFIYPDKPISQAALNMLAVRYGFKSQGNDSTTIGFGLIAEGYANFGFIGVLLAGMALGVLCGIITWLSSGASPTSLSMFVGIASLSVLVNLEPDFSYMLVTLEQTIISVVAVFFVLRALRDVAGQRLSPKRT
jgi:hypothetical protein